MHCDLDLWPFDLKIYRGHPWLMGGLHVKFHDDRCKGKAVMRRKPKCGRQTDGQTNRQTDMVIPVYPPNFVAGGIKRKNTGRLKNFNICPNNLHVYTDPNANADSNSSFALKCNCAKNPNAYIYTQMLNINLGDWNFFVKHLNKHDHDEKYILNFNSESINSFQEICKHKPGFITNTGIHTLGPGSPNGPVSPGKPGIPLCPCCKW